MRNRPSEIFELFRKQRQKNRNTEEPLPGPGAKKNAQAPGKLPAADSNGTKGLYLFRRDTVIVFGMLAAVAVAAAFFAGMLIGRAKTAPEVASAKPNRSRLFKPLEPESGVPASGDNVSSPAARIPGPVSSARGADKFFTIRVAAYPRSQVGNDFASKNAAILRERGFPADCRQRGRHVTIEVGKFAEKDDPGAKQMLSKLKAFRLGGGSPFKDAFITSVSR